MSERPRRKRSKLNLDLKQDWVFAIDAKVLGPWNGELLHAVVIKQLNSNLYRIRYLIDNAEHLIKGTELHADVDQLPDVQITTSTAQIPSSPVVDALSTIRAPSSPVVDALSTAQVPSSPILDAPSTAQVPSYPVVDAPSTAQSPSNPATEADVSSRYLAPLLLSNPYKKTMPKRRLHGPVLLKAKVINLPGPSTIGPSTSSEWHVSYEATTAEEALDLVDALNESEMVDVVIRPTLNPTNPGADTDTQDVKDKTDTWYLSLPGPRVQHAATALVNDAERLNQRFHPVQQVKGQRRCAIPSCKSRPRTVCTVCNVALCIPGDHYTLYHTIKDLNNV